MRNMLLGVVLGLLVSPVYAAEEDAEKALQEAIKAEMESEQAEEKPVVKPAKKVAKKLEEKAEEKAEEKTDAVEEKKPAKKAEKKKAEAKPVKKEEEKKAEEKKSEKKEEKPAAVAEEKLGEFDCPLRVSVGEQKLDKKAPAGFSTLTMDEKSYWLKAMHIYAGDKKLDMVDPMRGTDLSAEWSLMDNGKVHYQLVCSYGDTSLKLKKALDKKLSKCSLGLTENPGNPKGPQALLKMACE